MRLIVAILALLPLQSLAATAYDVQIGTGLLVTVVTDGTRFRADFPHRADEPSLYTSVLWQTRETTVALNAHNKTWYALKPDVLALKSHYLNPLHEGTPKKIRWTMSEAHGTYTARLTYTVEARYSDTLIEVLCTADYVIETTDQHPRSLWPGRILGDTRLSEVDAQLAAADETITRFPTRMTLTATRQYEDGPVTQDTRVIETRNVREAKTKANTFTRPADYRHQEPVLGIPGR